ncbi:MAG: ATP-binding protein [Deltaproteobacteria bacterium]|nr:ATP-binding protein [Deltaproteobacteria bacterium]
MNQEEKVIWQHHSPRYRRSFLQPLAVAVVSAVVIGLILIMGIVDLRRNEKNLLDFMENQGLGIIGVVQRLSQENLDNERQVQSRAGGPSFRPSPHESFAPKGLVAEAFANQAQEIDNRWKAKKLDNAFLEKFADEQRLWVVAVFDKGGEAVFQSRKLSPDLFAGVAIRPPRGNITIGTLAELARMKKIGGLFVLRPKEGSGVVVIALDPEGARYWSMKVLVGKAIDQIGQGQGQGLLYIRVTDLRGISLGETGLVPPSLKKGNMDVSEITAGRKKIVSRKVVFQDRNILDMGAPLYLDGKVRGIVQIGLERESTDRILKENRRNIFVFTVFIVVIVLLSLWLLYHDQNRHLAGIVEMERQLEKAERLSALGQLAAGVGHEIRNPLNAISMASQRLIREYTPPDREKVEDFQVLTGVIRDEIRRLNGIIEEFLTFSKSRRLEFHDYPVTEVLQKIVNLIREEAVTKGIKIETSWPLAPATIPMDMDKLQQALLNLVKNAMESIIGEGVIVISAERKNRDSISIKIADTGCGMTAEEVERIFNPEYTTKEKGLGLGLPLAHEIIRGHGGEIRVLSRQGEGTTFEVILPMVRREGKTDTNVKYA